MGELGSWPWRQAASVNGIEAVTSGSCKWRHAANVSEVLKTGLLGSPIGLRHRPSRSRVRSSYGVCGYGGDG
jgi:hypothetical protein